jgi:very-short-patch-repair endonuclease
MSPSSMTQLARNLRNNSTRQEKKLWYLFLRNFPLRFHRQKVVGVYIVDFYCHKAKLVIEIDGSQHIENTHESDNERTEYLQSNFFEVIRFSNHDVDNNFDGVCTEIVHTVNAKLGSDIYQ